MRSRLTSLAGLAVAYLVTGLVQSTLIGGASVEAFSRTLSEPVYALLWPVFLIEPTFWMYTVVGLVVGFGVLAGLERARLPITAPKRLPTPTVRHSAEAVTALLVAELVARFTTAAAFVAHLHIWPPHRGEPELSVAFYRDALAFFDGYAAELPSIVWFGTLLPESRSLLSGGPNQTHVLREVGGVQFFDGVGFAVVVGYGVALVLSYVVVRVVSRRVSKRFERA